MEQHFPGFLAGLLFAVVVFAFTRRSYRKLLVMKANDPHPTAEKLADGKFYYIVPEAKYGELTRLYHLFDLNREDLIKVLVNRFLAWPLPDTVSPDGMPFPAKIYRERYGHSLIGTHLLSAQEAEKMFNHVLDERELKL
jgi:hypothetical protein